MPKPTQKSSEQTFESALERLEQIVGEMEGDRLALEDLLSRYEEGTRLVKVCQQRLNTAEKRIELIAREASGEVELTGADSAASGQPQNSSKPSSISKRSEPEDVSLF